MASLADLTNRNADVSEVTARLTELTNEDIAFSSQLGEVSGFQEAESAKVTICDAIRPLAQILETHHSRIPESEVKDLASTLVQPLEEAKGISKRVISQAKGGVSVHDYERKRSQLIHEYKELAKTTANRIKSTETRLRVIKLENHLEDAAPEKSLAETRRLQGELRDAQSNYEELSSKLKALAVGSTVSQANAQFSTLRNDHKKRETAWLLVFTLSFSTSTWLIAGIALGEFSQTTAGIVSTVRWAVLASGVAVVARLAVSKYNLERNLRIVYDHRNAVLEQYPLFEAGLGENEEEKALLRLEIARHLFRDPQTGYCASSDSAAVSVNPVITAIDAVKKA